MAQLSTNTVFYDQLIKRVQTFLRKYSQNTISSYEDMSEEFHILITEINKYSTEIQAKFYSDLYETILNT